MSGEKVGIVVHDTVVVVTDSVRINSLRWDLLEICLITRDNVPFDDIDVLVTVRSTLLVPETNNMADLVHDYMKLETGMTNRNSLWLTAIGNSPNIGTAPGLKENMTFNIRVHCINRIKEIKEIRNHPLTFNGLLYKSGSIESILGQRLYFRLHEVYWLWKPHKAGS